MRDRSRPHILIADDHAVFAEALRALLEKTFVVVGIVPDGRALVSEATRLNPDLVVIDVGMPFLNGLEAARRMREQAPNIKLVFLTMRDDPNLAAAALELKRVGFVLKHSAARELLTAIETLLLSSEGAPNTMVARAMMEKKAIVSNDSQSDPQLLLAERYAKSGVRSVAVLPLIASNESVGVLALYANEIEFFHEEEMKLLTAFYDFNPPTLACQSVKLSEPRRRNPFPDPVAITVREPAGAVVSMKNEKRSGRPR
jgi:DNA-binding NarL/FixJ family response regulator